MRKECADIWFCSKGQLFGYKSVANLLALFFKELATPDNKENKSTRIVIKKSVMVRTKAYDCSIGNYSDVFD